MHRHVYEYISKQTNDPIVEWRKCANSGKEFAVFQKDKEFYHKISPTFNGEKHYIPFPTLCPEERQIRRLLFRNERKLYHTTCALTNKPILSIYQPNKGYTVYANDARWSDQWDALDYGRDFDFSKTFTEQFGTLLHTVPHPAVFNKNSENSAYCNHVGDMKNAYLTAASRDCEDIMYSAKCFATNQCIDVYETFRSEHCYETIQCEHCYKLHRSYQCDHCRDSYFLFDCHDCHHCFGCRNLVGKQYCRYNEQLTKETYQEKIAAIQGSYDALMHAQKQWHNNVQQHSIRPAFQQINSHHSVGDRITNATNAVLCYNVSDIEDCKYCENGALQVTDTYDAFGTGIHGEHSYEVVDTGDHCSNACFTTVVHQSHDMYYCRNCQGSAFCFGCVGLVNQEYCIFNKQYPKAQREQHVAKIISHMQQTNERGEFFDPTISPFAYNETIAQDMFPLSAKQAQQQGYQRYVDQQEKNLPSNITTINASTLPDSIDTVEDNILSHVIICEESNKPFRITKQELQFYRQHNIPLPRRHPDIRHQQRLQQKPATTMYLRKSDKSGENMLSVYPPDVSYKIYSHEEYKETLYS